MKKYLFVSYFVLVLSMFLPQVTLAVWYNPFTWNPFAIFAPSGPTLINNNVPGSGSGPTLINIPGHDQAGNVPTPNQSGNDQLPITTPPKQLMIPPVLPTPSLSPASSQKPSSKPTLPAPKAKEKIPQQNARPTVTPKSPTSPSKQTIGPSVPNPSSHSIPPPSPASTIQKQPTPTTGDCSLVMKTCIPICIKGVGITGSEGGPDVNQICLGVCQKEATACENGQLPAAPFKI